MSFSDDHPQADRLHELYADLDAAQGDLAAVDYNDYDALDEIYDRLDSIQDEIDSLEALDY